MFLLSGQPLSPALLPPAAPFPPRSNFHSVCAALAVSLVCGKVVLTPAKAENDIDVIKSSARKNIDEAASIIVKNIL